jgi:hypothetical protein
MVVDPNTARKIAKKNINEDENGIIRKLGPLENSACFKDNGNI